jgi:heterodisulfide reductase subunit A-like polyferredoxin
MYIGLQSPCCLSRVDHERQIRKRKQRTDIGKYYFVNRAIQLWNQLYVHSIMGYGIIFWGESSGVNKVFILQKKVIRIITNSR